VAYRDLDIGQADGAKALYARIKAASAEACGGAPDARVLGDRAAFDRCQRQSIDRALSHVASPAVTEMAGRGSGEVRVASR
jgi:UrcA family protein